MNFSIYSFPIRKTIRIICLIAMCVLSLGIYSNVINLDSDFYAFTKLIQNLFVAILIVILFIFPIKLLLIAIISYQYSLVILYIEPLETMAIYMFFLTIAVLFVRGFFNKQKWLKIIAITIPVLTLQLSELRFGSEIFTNVSINKVGHCFVMLLILFFSFVHFKNDNDSNKRLNIADYPNLRKRDAEWLIAIQNKQKYQWLSIEYKMSPGSVKNRLKVIFNTLEVGDKTGFLNKYSDYEIYYEEKKAGDSAKLDTTF